LISTQVRADQTETGAKGPLLKAFVEYVLSDDGQALLGDYNFEQAPQQVRDVGRKALELMALAPGHEEWTFESATNKGAGQEDYVISAKRRSHYEYALGEIESEMASYASLKALEATVAALAADVAASSAAGGHVHVSALDEIFPDDGDDEDKQDEEIELALAVATAGLVFGLVSLVVAAVAACKLSKMARARDRAAGALVGDVCIPERKPSSRAYADLEADA
jgi:hypothetical protein